MIHLNWVIGGKFGYVESLPTKENGERVLNPKKIDSAIIGIGLIAFGIFYMIKYEHFLSIPRRRSQRTIDSDPGGFCLFLYKKIQIR